MPSVCILWLLAKSILLFVTVNNSLLYLFDKEFYKIYGIKIIELPVSKSADTIPLNCICKYIKWLLHLLTECLEKMLLSDSLATLLTDNFVNLVDGGILLAPLFTPVSSSGRDLHPSGVWSFPTVGICDSFCQYPVFVTKMTTHTGCWNWPAILL